MNWTEIITAVGVNGLIIAIIGFFQNRKINLAAAKNSEAEFTSKLLDESKKFRDDALEDLRRVRSERDEAREEAKSQRTAKQGWREKFLAEQEINHANQLTIKDLDKELSKLEWHRCEKNACEKRMPPRIKITKNEKV